MKRRYFKGFFAHIVGFFYIFMFIYVDALYYCHCSKLWTRFVDLMAARYLAGKWQP